ncbi:MAG: hypothetical protein ACRDSL_07145 [Pseudonocardiaceae bacterium]
MSLMVSGWRTTPSPQRAKLTSVRARTRLEPLAAALDTRPGSDARDLSRAARQVATRA